MKKSKDGMDNSQYHLQAIPPAKHFISLLTEIEWLPYLQASVTPAKPDLISLPPSLFISSFPQSGRLSTHLSEHSYWLMKDFLPRAFNKEKIVG